MGAQDVRCFQAKREYSNRKLKIVDAMKEDPRRTWRGRRRDRVNMETFGKRDAPGCLQSLLTELCLGHH